MCAFIIGTNTNLNLKKIRACLVSLWLILHPCWHEILMPMCLLETLLQIHHAYALKYDKPWLIEHYIQIFNMLVFSHWLQYATHLNFLWNFRNIYGFVVDSKYVTFNKNIYFFLFFSYLSCVITPQLKQTISVSAITLSFLNHFENKLYGALKNTNLYML